MGEFKTSIIFIIKRMPKARTNSWCGLLFIVYSSAEITACGLGRINEQLIEMVQPLKLLTFSFILLDYLL